MIKRIALTKRSKSFGGFWNTQKYTPNFFAKCVIHFFLFSQLLLEMKGKLYRRKRSYAKRVFKKGKSPFRSYSRTKQLIRLINKVSLKKCETKQVHSIEQNQDMNHNSGIFRTGLLATSQGITDNDGGATTLSNRLGDQVVGRGIKFKFWVANKLDRPNIMYRLVVFKYPSLYTPTSSTIWKGANGNKIMDDFDKETYGLLYHRIFNIQVGFSASSTGTELLPANNTKAKEAHKYLSFYVPLKNMKIQYNDGGTIPKWYNIGFAIIPYDSYGTSTADTVSSVAWSSKFYFKDP